MTGIVDVDTIERLIRDGQARHLTARQLAEQIIALIEDPSWAKAMSHPLRGQILAVLRRDGPTSPSHAAEQLPGASLGTLAYHFRYLYRLGLIELADQIQRRGAIEHIYQLSSQGDPPAET